MARRRAAVGTRRPAGLHAAQHLRARAADPVSDMSVDTQPPAACGPAPGTAEVGICMGEASRPVMPLRCCRGASAAHEHRPRGRPLCDGCAPTIVRLAAAAATPRRVPPTRRSQPGPERVRRPKASRSHRLNRLWGLAMAASIVPPPPLLEAGKLARAGRRPALRILADRGRCVRATHEEPPGSLQGRRPRRGRRVQRATSPQRAAGN